ncbi:hypothetical protein DPMN_124429 [Dreissena polymorpha]|uniref:Uncharacterized protein n=1 Tax=Dreissena polymorpha TaxID=45954 RepID=A0A9D4GSL2_DREPO|nr:hypothetical protein DPMN_124429 [Dreissena polymorpha]
MSLLIDLHDVTNCCQNGDKFKHMAWFWEKCSPDQPEKCAEDDKGRLFPTTGFS